MAPPGSGTGTPVTGVSTPYEGIPFFSATWVWDNSAGAYINNTNEARATAGTAFTIFDATADYLYLGSQSRFDLAAFFLSVAGSVTGLTYQYYDGTGWITFIPGVIADFMISGASYVYDFTVDGAVPMDNLTNWTTLTFAAGTPHVAAPPDTLARYWVRISVTGITTSPTVFQIRKRPYAAYCTPSDIANLLQLQSDFSSTTTPTRNTIEDYIAAAQSQIDYRTQKSWRLNQKVEFQEFNMAGIKLQRRDAIKVTRLRIWDGAAFTDKVEGRQNDYFLVPDIGMVYFARYFLLPARMQSYNAPVWLWGWAEFTYPVEITYLYGRNRFTDDEQGWLAFDLARKMAAIDVFNSHDYSILTVSGTDKVSLERKIENWRIEIDEKLDGLRGWVTM